MSLEESLKLLETIKKYQPAPAIVELGKAVQKAKFFSDAYLKSTPISELGKIALLMQPHLIQMKNSEGLSRSLVSFNAFYEALKKNSQFFEYNIDLFKPKSIKEEAETLVVEIKERKRVKRIITDIYKDNKNLFQISPREFEEVVAELLFAQGFKVELTKQTRDHGYDILAVKDLKSQVPLKFLIECKRYTTQKVGVEIVRSFKEVILTEKANRGIIVTTSYFTLDAKKKQKDTPYLLDYRDKDKVIEWVKEYYDNQICS